MRRLIGIFIVAALISALITLVIKSKMGSETSVLSFEIKVTPSQAPSQTPMSTLTPTPIPTIAPTTIPTPLPTAIPTETPFPQPQFSQEQIHGFIERFSAQYGVDPNVMRYIATCESGFDALAINGPYTGLYQFGKNTWSNNRQLMGEDPDPSLRLNAEEAAQTAAFAVSIGKGWIWPNCFP